MAKQRQQVRKGSHGGMQLVLTEDVLHLGKQGELVEVKPGERQTLTHTFARTAQEAPRSRGGDWWRELKRKFGS